jgi:hypothetical protein
MNEIEPIERFRQRLATSASALSRERRKLKRYYDNLFAIALTSGSIATILGILASASGGKILIGSGPVGWKITCGIISLLTLVSTIAGSLQQNVRVKDRYWKIEDSYSTLKALLHEIEFDETQFPAVLRDYRRLVQRHPDVLDRE